MQALTEILQDRDWELRQEERLKNVFQNLPNLEIVEGTHAQPSHLIAHGTIRHGAQASEIRTTIGIKLGLHTEDDDVEFSTNVGQLPNTAASGPIVEGLNHRLRGKLVTFEEAHKESIDVVYTSRQPADWLDGARIRQELESHAVTRALVGPVLEQVSNSNQPNPDLTFPEIRRSIQKSISARLGAQIELLSESTTLPALSRPQSFSEDDS
jgi:hypothetical protein